MGEFQILKQIHKETIQEMNELKEELKIYKSLVNIYRSIIHISDKDLETIRKLEISLALYKNKIKGGIENGK